MKRIILSLLFSLVVHLLWANNIQVSQVSLANQNTGLSTVMVEFDISWENSWRVSVSPSNWDAAWIFVKFRANNGDWQHASLNYVNGTAASDGHTEPVGGTISTPSDGRGVFLYRNTDGAGPVNYIDVQLLWNYGVDGVNDGDILDVKVFAIEMVYMPQGPFSLGSGGTEEAHFYEYQVANPALQPSYIVSNENQIDIGTNQGSLYYDLYSTAGDQAGPLPAAFPKGFNAFYCMKYECSEGQWVDFFNTLTNGQKGVHDITDANHKNTDNEKIRNTISYTTGAATTADPDRACNYLLPADYLAYLDWAALRPMTELEFEKACRGTAPAVPNEYAWGNTNINAGLFTIMNDGQPDAWISNMPTLTGNCIYGATFINGPLRCGIISGSISQTPGAQYTREETGGSFYGLMEMSGNLSEIVISGGTPDGRTFTGQHGDGTLNVFGWADTPGWPANNALGVRGGSWRFLADVLRVSDRNDAANYSNSNFHTAGFRGVRTVN